jgi:ribosomal RNA-processing protein 36
MPSHRPVSRFRHVVPVLKRAARDPRFGQRSGKFNETMFKKAYSFLDGMKEGERQMAEKEMRKTRDPERKSQLHTLIQKMVITFHRAPIEMHTFYIVILLPACIF